MAPEESTLDGVDPGGSQASAPESEPASDEGPASEQAPAGPTSAEDAYHQALAAYWDGKLAHATDLLDRVLLGGEGVDGALRGRLERLRRRVTERLQREPGVPEGQAGGDVPRPAEAGSEGPGPGEVGPATTQEPERLAPAGADAASVGAVEVEAAAQPESQPAEAEAQPAEAEAQPVEAEAQPESQPAEAEAQPAEPEARQVEEAPATAKPEARQVEEAPATAKPETEAERAPVRPQAVAAPPTSRPASGRRPVEAAGPSPSSSPPPVRRPPAKPGPGPAPSAVKPGPAPGPRGRPVPAGPAAQAQAAASGAALERLQAEVERMARVLRGVEEHIVKVAEAYQRVAREGKRKEQAYDQLYEELRQYKANFLLAAQKPLFLDVILLYDGLTRTLRSFDEKKDEEITRQLVVDALEHARDEVVEVLYRRDIEVIAERPSKLDVAFQKPVSRIETDNEDEDRDVAQVVRDGFRMNGNVLRAQEVIVKRCLKQEKEPQA